MRLTTHRLRQMRRVALCNRQWPGCHKLGTQVFQRYSLWAISSRLFWASILWWPHSSLVGLSLSRRAFALGQSAGPRLLIDRALSETAP